MWFLIGLRSSLGAHEGFSRDPIWEKHIVLVGFCGCPLFPMGACEEIIRGPQVTRRDSWEMVSTHNSLG